MKTTGVVDKLTKRLSAVVMEAECFEEQRIIQEMFRALREPGAKFVVAREDASPIMFIVGEIPQQ